jgi:uncharacterized membrane protein
MNIILYVALVSTSFLLAFTGRIPAKPHKNVILETTLPKEKLQDPHVLAISNLYKKRLLQWAFVFLFLAFPVLMIPYDSLTLLYFFVILFSFIGIGFYLEIIYIRKMTALKVKNNWFLPTQPILVDTKLVANKNRKLISVWWFLPSLLLTILGAAYSYRIVGEENGFWLFLLIGLLLFGLFLLFYYSISRMPVKPLTSDEEVNQKVNDLMRYHWSVLMAVSALVISFLPFAAGLSIALPYEKMMVVSFAFFLVILLFVLFTFYFLFSLRKKQDQLISLAKEYRYSDEDQYWKYGIYMNPNDKRLLVPDRIGMNLSTNLGRPAGKIIMGITGILLFVILIAASVPMMISDFTTDPFQLSTSHNGIHLSAPFSKTRRIDWQDITSVELVNEVPKESIRVYGTATENYLTGEFQIADEPAYLLVYRHEKPILKIETANKLYYYTNKDSKRTEKYYQDIQTIRGK